MTASTEFRRRPLAVPLTELLGLSTDIDWSRARCAREGENPEDWHPFPRQRWDHARAVCGSCPIRLECGAWGRDNGQSGVWGGENLENGRPRRP